jgi:branched-chain amino acid transport system substrate-binding protein
MGRRTRQPGAGRSLPSRAALTAVSAGLSLGLVATACSSSSKSANSGSSGSTGTASSSGSSGSSGSSNGSTITIGVLTPLTGAAAANYKGSEESAQARVDAQNAEGGVNGHKLKLIVADDQSTPTGNLSAAQSLVNKGVFAIVGSSAFTFGSYKYLNQQGVPVTGGGYDGPEWGQEPNTNMFAYSFTDPHVPQYDQPADLMKDLGVTRVASVAYGESPSSVDSAKGFMFAAKNAGLDQAYLNTSLPFGTVNVGPIALALKSSNADGIMLPIDDETAFAIITAAQQEGVHFKAAISSTGYGQDLLSQPTTLAAGQGVYFTTSTAPVELETPATKAMQAAFAKYENFTGIPNLNWYQGWIATDMIIKGLQQAGANPTRASWMSAMRQVTSYDADGLLGYPVDFSKFGQALPQSCSWYMKLTGSKFVPYPTDGKPVCGNLIPNSNQA